MDSFATRYCALHQIPSEKFAQVVFRKGLYPHARLVHGLISFVRPDYFDPEYDLIATLGQIERLRSFEYACSIYRHHLEHAGVSKRVLRMRISMRRLYKLAAATMRAPAAAGGGEAAAETKDEHSAVRV